MQREAMQHGMRRTLGLLKDALLDTSSYRLVEERVEHVVGDRDRVVRTDVLLQLLTAAPRVSKSMRMICDDAHLREGRVGQHERGVKQVLHT